MALQLKGEYLAAPETTLRGAITFTGKGLFSGEECKIRLHPAEARTGIVLRRGHIAIPCTIYNIVKDVRHTSTLGSQGVRLRCVEHLLAAIYFCGITNCVVEVLKGSEVPSDGSGACGEYVAGILLAGLESQGAPLWSISAVSREQFSWNGSSATILPPSKGDSSGTLRIDVSISFAQPIGRQQVRWSSCESERNPSDDNHFAEARTFLHKDLRYKCPGGTDYWTHLHSSIRGLPVRKSELQLMAFEGGRWVVAPRYESEAAWHKLVDFLGDLSLLGAHFSGRIRIHKPGHAYNHQLVRRLSPDHSCAQQDRG